MQDEQKLSDVSEDIDDTIEDLNILAEEMRRRWKRLLSKVEQLRWDAEAGFPERQSSQPDQIEEDEFDDAEPEEDDGGGGLFF